MHIAKVGPDLRNRIRRICKYTNNYAKCHDDQTDAENRLNTSDNLIDGQECGYEVIRQNDPQPEFRACQNTAHSAF